MKRSQINAAIRRMELLAQRLSFPLPPFCAWTPSDWLKKGSEYDEIRGAGLGWDVTDYGLDKFDETGFTLITLRNGAAGSPVYKKTYAEKLIMLKEGQYSPMHFHWNKMEDIINRGGGNALIRVCNAREDGSFADGGVLVQMDGRRHSVPAGSLVTLSPGESITIYPYLYHDFKTETGLGDVLLGEVSMCNDDKNDNRFYEEKIGRFPVIEEDEPPCRLLCTEYPPAV